MIHNKRSPIVFDEDSTPNEEAHPNDDRADAETHPKDKVDIALEGYYHQLSEQTPSRKLIDKIHIKTDKFLKQQEKTPFGRGERKRYYLIHVMEFFSNHASELSIVAVALLALLIMAAPLFYRNDSHSLNPYSLHSTVHQPFLITTDKKRGPIPLRGIRSNSSLRHFGSAHNNPISLQNRTAKRRLHRHFESSNTKREMNYTITSMNKKNRKVIKLPPFHLQASNAKFSLRRFHTKFFRLRAKICLEQAQLHSSFTHLKVSCSWRINRSGRPEEIHITTQPPINFPLTSCLSRVIRLLRYPRKYYSQPIKISLLVSKH